MLPSELPEVEGLVALDTETSALHPDPPENGRVSVVSLAWCEGRGEDSVVRSLALPFDQGVRDKKPQATLDLWVDPNLPTWEWEALLDWLERRWLVMHGAKFDLMMMLVGLRFAKGRDLSKRVIWDTMLAARDLDAGEGAELVDVEERLDLLSPDEREEWHETKKKRKGLDLLDWSEVERYAATDARVTIEGFRDQALRYEEGEGDRGTLARELGLLQVLFGLEQRGVGYDAPRSLEVAKELQTWEHEISRELPFRGGIEKARKWFYSPTGGGAHADRFTETGRPALDEAAVQGLVAAGVPYAGEYAQLRRLETARTKWYEAYAEHTGADGRIRTVFSQGEVISGRLSSTRVNLQAIPQDYQLTDIAQRAPTPRALFRPRPGSRLHELDMSQAELRIAAKLADCRPMLRMIRRGDDLHGETARLLFHDEPGTTTWGQHRDTSKRANFALIFGVSADTFWAGVSERARKQTNRQHESNYLRGVEEEGYSLTEAETRIMVAGWKKLYPEYEAAIRKYWNMALAKKHVRLINGRVRWLAAWEDPHKMFNQMVQGSLAEFMKVWMIAVEHRWPGLLVLTIHDSLVLDTTDEEAVEGARRLGARIGTEMFGVPMVVDRKEWKAA